MNAITVISDEVVRNTVVRIERGQAAPEELTAITAVLLARAAACTYVDTPPAKHGRSKAGWHTPDHQAPNSWKS
ncbi:acyl-CoA carboxylase subunit epsilon [Streptomyces violascens]|uniref:acyl-CoA carboxylase subunit epsilon n=1 Tax=Streptomyces violascens TaxID=67381 RepID=UPI0037AC7D93